MFVFVNASGGDSFEEVLVRAQTQRDVAGRICCERRSNPRCSGRGGCRRNPRYTEALCVNV